MLLGTQAIVLHTFRHGDASVVARMYTRQLGLVSFLINGVKSKRAGNKAAFLQALSLLDIQIQVKENRGLQQIREIRVDVPYQGIPFSTGKTAQVLFMSEVLLRTIKEEERNDELFDFLRDALILLDQTPGELPDFHLKFLLEFSRFLGFYPINNYDESHPYFQFTDGVFHHSPGETCLDRLSSEAFYRLLNCGFGQLHELHFNRPLRRQLSRQLLDYFRWHLPSITGLHTPEVLEEVFG
jgi:DNA repair protein RecO (recombination protein O)